MTTPPGAPTSTSPSAPFPAGSVEGRRAVAAGLVGLAVLAVVEERRFRLVEAGLLASVLASLRMRGAQDIGVSVIFPAGGGWSGLILTDACSAALLIAPFLLLGAGLLATGRLGLRRGVLAVAVASALVFVLNQARLVVIVVAIRTWGVRVGYERGHVLAGTTISTLGELAGAAVFLFLLLRDPTSGGGRAVRHERRDGSQR